jgi:hypothetical protein
MGMAMIASAQKAGFEIIDTHHEMRLTSKCGRRWKEWGGLFYKIFRSIRSRWPEIIFIWLQPSSEPQAKWTSRGTLSEQTISILSLASSSMISFSSRGTSKTNSSCTWRIILVLSRAACNSRLSIDHGQFNDIGSGALDWGI